MEYYDLLKIIAVTKSCKLRIKELFSNHRLFNETDLASLCSFYVSLQTLESVFEDYYTKNVNKTNEKIEDKEFLEEILFYVKTCSYLEAEVNNFVSTEVN